MVNKIKKYIVSLIFDSVRRIIPRKYILPLIKYLLKKYNNDPHDIENLARQIFEFDNWLYKLESNIAIRHGDGIHPKHDLMNYHQFFVDRINDGDSVIDIGCGVGAVAFTIAKSTNANITGIDHSQEFIKIANSKYKQENLTFVLADVFNWAPDKKYDIIILSNVLEHFHERESFLIKISKVIKPKKILIRVPSIDRDWRVAYKNKIGAEYRLDLDHKIEYTREQIEAELINSNLIIDDFISNWGEYWISAKIDRI